MFKTLFLSFTIFILSQGVLSAQFSIFAGNGGLHANAPNGGALMSLDPTTYAGTVISVPFDDRGITGLGVMSNGNLVAVSSNRDGDIDTYLYFIDPETGNVIGEPIILYVQGEGPSPSPGIVDLSVQPGTDIIYGITWSNELVTINPNSGLVTYVGDLDGVYSSSLAFGTDGTLYIISYDEGQEEERLPLPFALLTVNPSTGATISGVSLGVGEEIMGLGFHPGTGMLLGSGCCFGNDVSSRVTAQLREFGDIYEINPATGAANLIGSSGMGVRVHDIVVAPDGATQVPTLGQWGIICLGLFMFIFAIGYIKKSKTIGVNI